MNSSRLLIAAQFLAFLGCGEMFAQTYPPAMNLSRYMPVTARDKEVRENQRHNCGMIGTILDQRAIS